MQLRGNSVLITGGSEGIGLELARTLAADNRVIICGRDEAKLSRIAAELPQLSIEPCDITDAVQRDELVRRIVRDHPQLNVLINNAGGRQRVDMLATEDLEAALVADTELNYVAHAALCSRLTGQLCSRPRAHIVNISSGLIYLPKATQPFYCAAKSALHSYTRSLRWALRDSSVRVHEVMMSLVDTGFHRGELPRTIKAISAAQAARLTLEGLRRDRDEIRIGKSALARWLACIAPGKGMALVNR